MTIEQKIAKLEQGFTVPGTIISRTLMDVPLARQYGVFVPQSYTRRSIMVWSIAVGLLNMPKQFIVHGGTIGEAVNKALQEAKRHVQQG